MNLSQNWNWSSLQKTRKTHMCDSIIHVRILIKTLSAMPTRRSLRPKTYCKPTSPTCHWNLMALTRLMTNRLFDASSSIEGRQQTIRVELCQSQVPNEVSRKINTSIGQSIGGGACIQSCFLMSRSGPSETDFRMFGKLAHREGWSEKDWIPIDHLSM